jgi:rhomboid protease GluP
LRQVLREAPATVAIMVACIVVFVLAERAGSTKNPETLLRFGAVWRSAVWDGQYWRLATSMFLHIGPMHLFWNWLFGFKLCAAAESELGSWKFLALYLGSGVAGAAASVIGHDAISAGASGALFGLIGWRLVSLRLQLGSWRTFTQNPPIRQELIWIVSWFVLGAFIGFDNYAHGGGMLLGALFSWALGAGAQARPARRRRMAAAIGIGALLVAASLRPLPVLHAGALTLSKAIAAQNDPAKVMALTEPLLASERYRHGALRLRAWALVKLDRLGEAVDAANELVDADPKDARARVLRAFALYHGGQYARAEADINEAVQLDPSPWVRQAREDLLRQPRR